jgi:hypothetical protein
MKKINAILIAFLIITTFATAQKALHGEVTVKKDTVYVGGKKYCLLKTKGSYDLSIRNLDGREIVRGILKGPSVYKILFVESGRTAHKTVTSAFVSQSKELLREFETYEVIINSEVDKKGELRFIRQYPDRDLFGKIIQKASEAVENDLEQASRDGFTTKEAESLKARNPSANANATDTPTQGSTTAAPVAQPAVPSAANDVIDRDRTKTMTLDNGEIKQDNQLVGKYTTTVGQWNNETTIILKYYFAGGKQIAEARVPLSKSTEAEIITLKDNQKHAVPTPNNSKETDIAKFLLDRYYF